MSAGESLPDYDEWKLATPPEYEESEDGADDDAPALKCEGGCGRKYAPTDLHKNDLGERLCDTCPEHAEAEAA